MNKELRILILDDVPTDADLMTFELAEAGMAFKAIYASDKDSFLRSLEDDQPEIILSDYSLPSFDGLSALKIAKEKHPEIPFIFVTGALGEETAIKLLKQGATDYVLKGRLSRLAPAVSRALQEVAERKERMRCEAALEDSEIRYRTIFENTRTATIIIEEDMTIVLANKQFEKLTGFPRSDIEGKKNWEEFVLQDDPGKKSGVAHKKGFPSKTPMSGNEFRIVNRNRDILYVIASIASIPSTTRKVLSLLDITERLEAEKKIMDNNQMLRTLSSELVMTEERERRRIAVDLHDNIGQTLALTKIKLNALMEQESLPCTTESILEILEMVDQSIQQTRSLTRELSPSVLYELGLSEAIEWLAEQIFNQHGLQIVLKYDLKSRKIDKDVQIFLYRSIRELLLNIIKHAKAKEAHVTLRKTGENIIVTVRDDGIGFDIASIDQISNKSGGFGLLSIRERLNYIGGRLEIETRKGWGTQVEMVVLQKKRKRRK
ncbi:MAG: PAS domain S-box protein [Syntrophales bacterium]|nr:PAS domain S-box protein [Syntrophales bacterium]